MDSLILCNQSVFIFYSPKELICQCIFCSEAVYFCHEFVKGNLEHSSAFFCHTSSPLAALEMDTPTLYHKNGGITPLTLL